MHDWGVVNTRVVLQTRLVFNFILARLQYIVEMRVGRFDNFRIVKIRVDRLDNFGIVEIRVKFDRFGMDRCGCVEDFITLLVSGFHSVDA